MLSYQSWRYFCCANVLGVVTDRKRGNKMCVCVYVYECLSCW